MPVEELDLVDEILGAAAAELVARQPNASESTSVVGAPISIAPERRLRLRNPFAGARSRTWNGRWVVGFGLAFAAGAIACLAVLGGAAVAAFSANSNRVIAGVEVGSVDLSGMSRDQVIARLHVAYAYLGQGEVTVTTPTGAATITYQQLGRAPDVEFMADEAMRIGHSGNPIGDAATMLRTIINADSLPIAVRIDPTAVATSLRQLAGANVVPQDAQASVQYGTFAYSSSASGRAIDEAAISSALINHLAEPNAPANFQAGGAFVELRPRVSDKDAQAAIAAAQKMVVDVSLLFGGDAPTPAASGSPVSSQTTKPPKISLIEAKTVLGWIVFGTNSDGRYGPTADPAPIRAYLSGLSAQIRIAPVEPTIVFDSSGALVSLKGGSDGTEIDAVATSRAISAYLDSLASGEKPVSAVTAITAAVAPNVTVDGLSHLVAIGSWTTTFFPDVSNGNGANIRVPAKLLNGQVVAPGQQFGFLSAVSPVDQAHGYTWGGVIEQGKSDHTGAMGGGICSASTTMFNAAARAGLQIDERHPHFYYIGRYPIGLDATVYSNGYQVWDLKWTNDTPNPIVILAGSTYGSKSTITVQLWSLPLARTVAFSPEFRANVVRAADRKVYVSTLKPNQQNRTEYPTDGFDTSRTRTVTDSTGKVIHTETWTSHYTKVDGILQIGGSPPAPPVPPPAAPSAAPVLPPAAPAVGFAKSKP